MTDFNEKRKVLQSLGLSEEEIENKLIKQFPEYPKFKVLKDLGMSDSEIKIQLEGRHGEDLDELVYNLYSRYSEDTAITTVIKDLYQQLGIERSDILKDIVKKYLTESELTLKSNPSQQITIDDVVYNYNKKDS